VRIIQEDTLPKFIIEREMPQVGKLTDSEFQGAAQKSCDVLRGLGPEVQWIESYVTADTTAETGTASRAAA
jgi:Protein of unknown function (DUF4242)